MEGVARPTISIKRFYLKINTLISFDAKENKIIHYQNVLESIVERQVKRLNCDELNLIVTFI